ncbi:unnamed protein product [Closterium sp. Yama58-4]|nr:unnamed protein product [Closterium sp. Yama58-4]
MMSSDEAVTSAANSTVVAAANGASAASISKESLKGNPTDRPIELGLKEEQVAEAAGPTVTWPSPSLSACFSSLLSAHLSTPSAPNRLVLRSVCSQRPLLLLVLLSAHTAMGWGLCGHAGKGGGNEEESKGEDSLKEEREENEGEEGGLRRVVKLMCKPVAADSDAASEADEWGAKGYAEDVYVMPVTALELQGCLNENSLLLPPTCREFNGFTVSFLQV